MNSKDKDLWRSHDFQNFTKNIAWHTNYQVDVSSSIHEVSWVLTDRERRMYKYLNSYRNNKE